MNHTMNNLITGLNALGSSFCDYAGSMFIQAGVLIVVLLIIELLIRKRVRATFRYWMWILVFVKLLLPPTLSLPTGIGYWFGDCFRANPVTVNQLSDVTLQDSAGEAASPAVAQAPYEPAPRAVSDAATVNSPLNSPVTAGPTALTWKGILFGLWILGVLAISALLVQRIFFVRGLIAQSESAENGLAQVLNECCQRLGLQRRIELRLSHSVTSPAVCGLFRPAILMPEGILERLSQDKLRAVLLHELAHIKRDDLWVNCIQTFLQIAYFYNPLVWLANTVVRRIREQAVDEMVLVALGAEAKSYSNALIDVAEMAFSRPALSLRLVGVVESKKALSGRIRHMLNRPIPKRTKVGVAGTITIIVVAAALLPMAKAQKVGVSVTEKEHSPVQFTAALPDGLVVELVGLCEYPSEGKQWWQPDGALLERPYEKLNTTYLEPNYKLYELVYRVSGADDVSPHIAVNNYVKGTFGMSCLTQKAVGIKLPNAGDCYSVVISCEQKIEKVSVRLLIESDSHSESVIFKNVLLRPGVGTDVQIEAERPAVLRVPSERYPTIPSAVAVAKEGDTVLSDVSEQNKRRASTQESSQCKVTLPDGVVVELVGLCEHPSEGKQWWQPDGSSLRQKPYRTIKADRTSVQPDEKAYEFVVRTDAPEPFDMTWETKPASESYMTSFPQEADNTLQSNVRVLVAKFSKEQKGCALEIRMAPGPWFSLCEVTENQHTYSFGDFHALVMPPRLEGGRYIMRIQETNGELFDRNYKRRYVLKLKDSDVFVNLESLNCETTYHEGRLRPVEKLYVLDPDLQGKIQYVAAQYGVTEIAAFENISLSPSRKTKVVASSRSAGHPAFIQQDPSSPPSPKLSELSQGRIKSNRQLCFNAVYPQTLWQSLPSDKQHNPKWYFRINGEDYPLGITGQLPTSRHAVTEGYCFPYNLADGDRQWPQGNYKLNLVIKGTVWLDPQGKRRYCKELVSGSIDFRITEGAFATREGQPLLEATTAAQAANEEDRVALLNNLKYLALAIRMYADDHDASLPEKLQVIKEYMRDERVFAWALENVEYLGKGITSPDPTSPTASRQPVAYYRTSSQKEDGTAVAFLDGHVEFVAADRLAGLGITLQP